MIDYRSTRQQTIKDLKAKVDDLEGRLEDVNHIAGEWEDSGYYSEKQLAAYETITGIKRDDIESHADPKDDSKMTFKTFDEYEEQIEELEEELTTSQYQYDMAIQIDNKEIACLKEELEEEKGINCCFEELEEENKKLKEDKRLLYVISKKMIDAHIAEHPEDAVAKEGFASEAEYQAWKKKAMGIPVGY